MIYSPLRYPGGKAKLEPFVEYLIEKTGHSRGTYIEPYAGGAAIALELLAKEKVSQIVINDYDKAIYSFWKAILNDTDRFVRDIANVPISVKEWEKQRDRLQYNKKYSYELGFAAFYMNRTNRSGIIKGGIIGGREQKGKWGIDSRFNREELIRRIKLIASMKEKIHIYNKDAISFIMNYLPRYQDDAFVYFDPPYYLKGKQLYLSFYSHYDHKAIRDCIGGYVFCDWIVTYDDVSQISDLYKEYPMKRIELRYSAAEKRKAKEIIVFKDRSVMPANRSLRARGIEMELVTS